MKFGKFEVRAGGKITPDAPVILDWTKSKHINERGDNDTGKSSIIELMLVGIGQLSGEKIYEKLTNKQTGKLDIELPFVGKDRLSYVSRVTKSGLKLIYEGESLPSPLTKLKELIGVAGVSPMEIKNKPVRDIVKWLASYTNRPPEEFEKQMDKIKEGIKKAKEARAAANKSAKALSEYLENEPLFINWEESEKKYKKSVDIKELSAQLEEAGKKSDKYIQNESKVKHQKERKAQIEDQLAELQKELKTVDSNIAIGDKWLNENKAAKKEYDDIKVRYDNAAKEIVAYNKWTEIKNKEEQKRGFEKTADRADKLEKELLQEMKELQLEILPDIKGVEIVLEDTHENGGKIKKEGFYKDGISSVQMGETGWWDIVMQIWRKNKVKIVVVDNFQSLGSQGVARLEQLEKDGCYILTAEMDREQKTLEIEYK